MIIFWYYKVQLTVSVFIPVQQQFMFSSWKIRWSYFGRCYAIDVPSCYRLFLGMGILALHTAQSSWFQTLGINTCLGRWSCCVVSLCWSCVCCVWKERESFSRPTVHLLTTLREFLCTSAVCSAGRGEACLLSRLWSLCCPCFPAVCSGNKDRLHKLYLFLLGADRAVQVLGL